MSAIETINSYSKMVKTYRSKSEYNFGWNDKDINSVIRIDMPTDDMSYLIKVASLEGKEEIIASGIALKVSYTYNEKEQIYDFYECEMFIIDDISTFVKKLIKTGAENVDEDKDGLLAAAVSWGHNTLSSISK